MKKVLRTVALFCLLMLLLIATVSCSNILDGLFGGNEEGTTPEATTSKVTTPEVTTPEATTPEETVATTPETTNKEEPDMEPTYYILFIGNSYTYYNDMPTAIFEQMARSMGYKTEVTAITKGAYKLSSFADPADEYGAKVEAALSSGKKFDFVILQEQSARPATDNVDKFYSAVRSLAERIRAIGATPILYSTWGRKAGHETLEKYGWTNETMTWRLAAAYQAIGDELGIPVAHAGLAFFDIYTGDSGIEVYDKDLTHPSYAGSYLAAATLFAKIFNADPTEVAYRGSLSETNATTLRQAAKKAVFETPAIPDEYKIVLGN